MCKYVCNNNITIVECLAYPRCVYDPQSNLHNNQLRKHYTVSIWQIRKQIKTCTFPQNFAITRGCAGRVATFVCVCNLLCQGIPGCLTSVDEHLTWRKIDHRMRGFTNQVTSPEQRFIWDIIFSGLCYTKQEERLKSEVPPNHCWFITRN